MKPIPTKFIRSDFKIYKPKFFRYANPVQFEIKKVENIFGSLNNNK